MRILCITSGKGGVGKTTLAINLGIAMARAGQRVLLFDGDLGKANLNVQLRVNPKFTIQDVVSGRKKLPEIIVSTDYGFDLLPGGTGIAELADLGEFDRQRVIWSIEELRGYDMLIIDTGAGIGDNVIRFILLAETVILVATPEPTSVADAYGIAKVTLAKQRKALTLLVNHAESAAAARQVVKRLNGATDRFMSFRFDFIGFVATDRLIQESTMKQKPYLTQSRRTKSARQIEQIAKRLTDRSVMGITGSLIRLFRRLFGY